MQKIIEKLTVPKVILRYIMMNFTDIQTIENVILNVKIMNVLDNYSQDILIKAKNGFLRNCENGYLTVAKWLYNIGGVDIHAENELEFAWSCNNGHLAIAQWLYSLGNVNIHAENEAAFRWSCNNGHLAVAQWLYGLGNVNIHAKNEAAFTWSCNSGHLAVAQWLYGLGNVNIHANNEYVFHYCDAMILNWLQTIKN